MEGRAGLVVIWSDGKLQTWLHWCWDSLTICVAKPEQGVLEICALGAEDPAI